MLRPSRRQYLRVYGVRRCEIRRNTGHSSATLGGLLHCLLAKIMNLAWAWSTAISITDHELILSVSYVFVIRLSIKSNVLLPLIADRSLAAIELATMAEVPDNGPLMTGIIWFITSLCFPFLAGRDFVRIIYEKGYGGTSGLR